jgi:prolyl-tRNA synthetase
MAAAVEQHHDETGIRWPRAIAPYDVHVLALTGGAEEVTARAEEVARALEAAGHDVLLDDRDARPGEKFADADLIGAPVRITVGKRSLEDGAVDARRRDGDTDERVMIDSVVNWVQTTPW